MKRITAIGLVVFLALFTFSACKKEAAAPKAGTAKATDMLGLLPVDVQGVFFVDVHKAMTTEFATKMIQENESYEKYQEFVQKSGIDPQKDIYFLAVGLAGPIGGQEQEMAAVVNLKYDKDVVMALIQEKVKEEGQELQTEEYDGYTLYKAWEKGESGAYAFINDSNIVIGTEMPVKSVLDVLNKKKDNVFKNEKLAALLEKTNKEAMFWGAMLIPAEAMEQAASSNPMMGALKSVNAVALYFDYKDQNLIAEIMAMSPDADSNKQVADALTGIKSFGAMAAGEKPEIGELLNAIEISSGEDHVKIYAKIPEELIKKLQADIPKEKEQEEKEEK
jgi:hypothetical protein